MAGCRLSWRDVGLVRGTRPQSAFAGVLGVMRPLMSVISVVGQAADPKMAGSQALRLQSRQSGDVGATDVLKILAYAARAKVVDMSAQGWP